MHPVVEAISLLTPYDIDVPKRRIGPDCDGGYVFADRISAAQAVFSYGIGTEYRFDIEMAAAGHHVYMFDHTIAGIERADEKMQWFREGVAGETRAAENLCTIGDHVARLGAAGDSFIMKMDVEGAEYAALGEASEGTLAKFDQIVLEIHELVRLGDPTFRGAFVNMMRKLNRQFTIFHVHANNCDGPNGIHIVDGMPVSNLLELSFIRKSLVTRTVSKTLYPTVLDYPNIPQKDKLLWFFPFLPTSSRVTDFATCEELLSLRHRQLSS